MRLNGFYRPALWQVFPALFGGIRKGAESPEETGTAPCGSCILRQSSQIQEDGHQAHFLRRRETHPTQKNSCPFQHGMLDRSSSPQLDTTHYETQNCGAQCNSSPQMMHNWWKNNDRKLMNELLGWGSRLKVTSHYIASRYKMGAQASLINPPTT